FAEEEPGSQRLIDEAGVLADPAEPREARIAALQEGRRVYADFPIELLNDGEPLDQVLEPAAQHVVIIFALSVTRYRRIIVVAAGVIELPNADNAFRRRQEFARVAAEVTSAIREIAHLARPAARHPLFVPGEVGRGLGTGDPREFKSAL